MLNIVPTKEQRAEKLAEVKANFEQTHTEPGAWNVYLQEWREVLAQDPATTRGEFMLHFLLFGMPPAWADALATELGVPEYSDDAIEQAAQIIGRRDVNEPVH